MNWNKKDIINICKIVAFGIVLYWALQNMGLIGIAFGTVCKILSPFIVGAAMAFIINIPMSIFENKLFFVKSKKKKSKVETKKVSTWKRLLSIILSIAIIVVILIGIIFLIIPELIDVIAHIIQYLPDLFNQIRELLTQIVKDYPDVEDTMMNLQKNLEIFNKETIKELTTLGTNLVTSSFGVISSTVSTIWDIVVSVIFSVYLLMGKEKIMRQLKRITYAFLNEKTADKVAQIARLSKESFYNFVTGQFTECIILGSLCCIGMLILRIPYSATVGVLVAVTAFIPIVGAIIGAGIGIILLLPVSLTKAITFLVFFVILQQLENNLIYPKVVGESVGVPGVLVLISVTLGGSLGGAVGMVIALPITSVLYTLLRESTSKRLQTKGIEPVPVKEEFEQISIEDEKINEEDNIED